MVNLRGDYSMQSGGAVLVADLDTSSPASFISHRFCNQLHRGVIDKR